MLLSLIPTSSLSEKLLADKLASFVCTGAFGSALLLLKDFWDDEENMVVESRVFANKGIPPPANVPVPEDTELPGVRDIPFSREPGPSSP